MLINQITQSTPTDGADELRTLAVAEFMAACPLMTHAQFYTITGNADSPRKATEIYGGDNRAVGADYATPKSANPSFGSVALKIYGDKVKTDIANQRRGIDIGSQRAKDLRGFARSLGRYFTDAVVNDQVAATKFGGLAEQVTALGRDAILGGGPDGYEVPSGDSAGSKAKRNNFIEQVDQVIEEVDPTVILLDSKTIARIQSIGREFVRTDVVANVFGVDQVVTRYRERPLVNAGLKKDRSGPVIGHAETVGASTDCTSMYFLRFEEGADVTFATNVGFDVQDLGLVGSEYITLVEFDVDLAILNDWAVKRLTGIRVTAN